MIICDLNDWQRERDVYHPVINDALQWLAEQDLTTLAAGKHDMLPDNQMFCLIQQPETGPVVERRPESHYNYVDIQFLISGAEKIGVARLHPDNIIAESKPEHDIVFYQQVVNESVVSFRPGMFAVFFPHDIHRPCCQDGEAAQIRKAVVKINLSLFAR